MTNVVKMISAMYIVYHKAGVDPNGANQSPRRVASRTWCVNHAVVKINARFDVTAENRKCSSSTRTTGMTRISVEL